MGKQKENSAKKEIHSGLSADSRLREIAELCKRRGFVFQTSDIYGGFSGAYDFGPLGAPVVQNIKNVWTREIVNRYRNVVSLDGAIVSHPRTWEASGHLDKFDDPLVEDLETNKRYRADHILEEQLKIDTSDLKLSDMQRLFDEHQIKSPEGNELSKIKSFNLMVPVQFGSAASEDIAYLRGETCQNIFANFDLLLNTTRQKIPFGVTQIGKAFRNEVSARQFILRTREFEQLEFEFFFDPEDPNDWFTHWGDVFLDILDTQLGLPKNHLRLRELSDVERSHYASRACDFEFQCQNGDWLEVSPLNNRTDWDLSRHSEYSGKTLQYFDQEKNRSYTPHVIETSFGIARLFYLLFDYGLKEEEVSGTGEKRTVFQIKPHLAPYQIAVLPLSKKEPLIERSEAIFSDLVKHWSVEFDERGSIGKRYRRQDEIGTPYCITVDFDSLEDNAVTIRDRDSMQQERINQDQLISYLSEKF